MIKIFLSLMTITLYIMIFIAIFFGTKLLFSLDEFNYLYIFVYSPLLFLSILLSSFILLNILNNIKDKFRVISENLIEALLLVGSISTFLIYSYISVFLTGSDFKRTEYIAYIYPAFLSIFMCGWGLHSIYVIPRYFSEIGKFLKDW